MVAGNMIKIFYITKFLLYSLIYFSPKNQVVEYYSQFILFYYAFHLTLILTA